MLPTPHRLAASAASSSSGDGEQAQEGAAGRQQDERFPRGAERNESRRLGLPAGNESASRKRGVLGRGEPRDQGGDPGDPKRAPGAFGGRVFADFCDFRRFGAPM